MATAKANEEKAAALKVLNSKTGEQQVVIDAATKHEIEQIQAIRIAKENAATAKYNAAKSALDKEDAALDGFAEREKTRIQTELNNKIAAENAWLKAKQASINAELKLEQQKATVEKQKVDQSVEVKSAIAELQAQLATLQNKQNKPTFGVFSTIANDQETARIQAEIAYIKKQAHLNGIPGFASGVVNWQGGLARVNENGGEIQYLNKGTTVVPNDVSMEIARSIGAAMGGSSRVDAQLLAENNSLMRQLIGLVQSGQRQPINLDGRSFGEAALPGLMGAATRQGKAWPVKG